MGTEQAGGAFREDRPYGVCAHLHRVKDPEERREECAWIAATGIQRVRFDFEWRRMQKSADGPIDFSHYDAVMADAEAAGLRVLPIIFDNKVPAFANPVWEHLPEWTRFVEELVAHYGDAFDEVEFWNEENLKAFWEHDPVPERYVEVLKAAYEAAKRANPRVRVLFGGLAGIPLPFIERCYQAGAAPCFDAMNVHPYSHPNQPEGSLDERLAALRELMAHHGDAEKPVVITEHGWPTHDARVDGMNVLRAGLKIARPEQKTWRAVFAATSSGPDGRPPSHMAESIEEGLPPGSTCEACFGDRLRERLAAGDVDLVIYPFDETYPADTFEDVRAFVDRGGVLADLGGMPMWFPVSEPVPGRFVRGEQENGDSPARRALKIAVSAWWMDPSLPEAKAKAFPTAEAKAAGYLGDPAGDPATRYQTPAKLGPEDEWIPLLEIENGGVAASVARLDGGRRGCVIVSGVNVKGASGSAGETGQARYLPRAMAIAFAMGVEEYFWYEFRAREIDPQYSEHHFGLTHQNFTPKPAWGAYRNFVLARPAGSVQAQPPWCDENRVFFYPQWTRPDGTKAGIAWKLGDDERRVLSFDSPNIRFRDFTGRLVPSVPAGENAFLLKVGENPVYFEGGWLEPVN